MVLLLLTGAEGRVSAGPIFIHVNRQAAAKLAEAMTCFILPLAVLPLVSALKSAISCAGGAAPGPQVSGENSGHCLACTDHTHVLMLRVVDCVRRMCC